MHSILQIKTHNKPFHSVGFVCTSLPIGNSAHNPDSQANDIANKIPLYTPTAVSKVTITEPYKVDRHSGMKGTMQQHPNPTIFLLF